MGKRGDPRRTKRASLAAAGLLCGMLGTIPAQAEPVMVKQQPLPDDVWMDMVGKSWHPGRGCPSQANLVLLTVPFRSFAGQTAMGELVVAKSVAPTVSRIFSEIYRTAAFRIDRMERVDKYGGSDDAAMAANNTSAIKFRTPAGSAKLSAHAPRPAVGINPLQHPYFKNPE